MYESYTVGAPITFTPIELKVMKQLNIAPSEAIQTIANTSVVDDADAFYEWIEQRYGYTNVDFDDPMWVDVCDALINLNLNLTNHFLHQWGSNWYNRFTVLRVAVFPNYLLYHLRALP